MSKYPSWLELIRDIDVLLDPRKGGVDLNLTEIANDVSTRFRSYPRIHEDMVYEAIVRHRDIGFWRPRLQGTLRRSYVNFIVVEPAQGLYIGTDDNERIEQYAVWLRAHLMTRVLSLYGTEEAVERAALLRLSPIQAKRARKRQKQTKKAHKKVSKQS